MNGIQQIRRGFKTIEEAEEFLGTLACQYQFEIEAITSENLLAANCDYIAYCVIPKITKQSNVAH